MSNFTNTVDLIGDETLTTKIIDDSITEYKDNYVTIIGKYAFGSSNRLTIVDIPNVTSIADVAFCDCSELKSLILRNPETVCTLGPTNVFLRTPITSGTGYIYVPAALVNSYKAATNWKTYANQIRALEDYTVDGTISGELDETKI